MGDYCDSCNTFVSIAELKLCLPAKGDTGFFCEVCRGITTEYEPAPETVETEEAP